MNTEQFNLADYLTHQREWSARTFGEGRRTVGIIRHIESELDEIEANPTDLMEWSDVIILAMDGAWRAGHEPEAIVEALKAKQEKNFARKWPAPLPEDQPTNHIKDVLATIQDAPETEWAMGHREGSGTP